MKRFHDIWSRLPSIFPNEQSVRPAFPKTCRPQTDQGRVSRGVKNQPPPDSGPCWTTTSFGCHLPFLTQKTRPRQSQYHGSSTGRFAGQLHRQFACLATDQEAAAQWTERRKREIAEEAERVLKGLKEVIVDSSTFSDNS
ncbi:hypothetical protein niasHS_001203 [Heterodera schachtii]|uniref:Uncharacterized protein n=1 Tax=Heterodera schachtii TaxID=97005 RepID=A0ABD2KN31_HETSC